MRGFDPGRLPAPEPPFSASDRRPLRPAQVATLPPAPGPSHRLFPPPAPIAAPALPAAHRALVSQVSVAKPPPPGRQRPLTVSCAGRRRPWSLLLLSFKFSHCLPLLPIPLHPHPSPPTHHSMKFLSPWSRPCPQGEDGAWCGEGPPRAGGESLCRAWGPTVRTCLSRFPAQDPAVS